MEETVRQLVTDANFVVAAAVAFAAGVVSFASPCVVPLVPGYVSYMTGLSGRDLDEPGAGARGRVLLGGTLFVLGFAVPFVMIGVAVGALNFLATNRAVQVAMGLTVAALGLLMARGRLVRELRVAHTAPAGGVGTAPVLGFVFGVGWTPCVGPALGAILTLGAATSGGLSARGGALAFVYALGLGLPFIVVGLLFRRGAGALERLRRNAHRLQVAGGGLLVATGVVIAAGWWNDFIGWLRVQPWFADFQPPI